MTMEEIGRNPAMTKPRDLQPMISLAQRHSDGTSRGKRDFVEVWTVYEKMERTWFQIVPNQEKLLRQPDDWPIGWEDLPFDALYFNEQMDSMFPVSYAEIIYPSVVERNKVRTLTMDLVKRMRRVIPYDKTQLGEGEEAKLENLDNAEFIAVEGSPGTAFGNVQLGGFDQSLLALDALHVTDIREALGQSSLDRAQRINVETAQEAAGVQQGSAVHQSRNGVRLEDFLSSTIRHYAQARRETMTEDEIVSVLSRDDAAVLLDGEGIDFATVTPDQVRGEFDFAIRAGSAAPKTKESEVREAIADLQIMSQYPEMHEIQEGLADYWRTRGKDPSRVLLTQEQQEITAEAGAGAAPTEAAGDLTGLLQQVGGGGGGLPQ
jgi:hypothetical protein